MKSYNDTTSSMKDQKLSISRRHFVATATATPLALGATSLVATPAQAAGVMDIREDDNVLGDRNAPIGIVEYASLTCPHCANFHNGTLNKVEKDYIETGKAYLIFRDFPLDRFAFQASVLAHTAGEKRFFAVLSVLFAQQRQWSSANNIQEALAGIAKQVGIPRAKFEAALQDEKLGESILMDRMVAANEYKVNSTPTLFINGDRYNGNWENYAEFSEYLNGLI